MKVRIKYRLHGLDKPTLQPGQVIDLDEDEALTLIKMGVAEEVDVTAPPCGGGASAELVTNLRVALAAKEADREAAEKEVFALRDEKAALEKQVAALKEALKKAKDKDKPSSGPAEPAKPQGGV